MSNMRPGKGAHFVLDTEVQNWINVSTAILSEVWETIDTEDSPQDLINILVEQYGWKKAKDKFGLKAYTGITSPTDSDNEYRITVVLNSCGELKLDVREWYLAG